MNDAAFESWVESAKAARIEDAARIVTRQQSLSMGTNRYFTWKPCCRGHISERVTSTRKCVKCVSEYDKRRYATNESRRGAGKARYAADPEKHRRMRKEYVAKNITKVRESQREYHKKNREARNAKTAAWRAVNIERFKQGQRDHYEKNREAILKKNRERYAKNPEMWKGHNRNRRAREMSAEGHHTTKDIARIRTAQRDRCACCCIKLDGGGHVDHIVSLSNGGSNWPSNLQLLCKPCNLSKHTRDPIEFMQSRGRLL